MHLSCVRPFVCPYVCPGMGYSSRLCCFGPSRHTAQQRGVRRANAGSVTLSAYVRVQATKTCDFLRYTNTLTYLRAAMRAEKTPNNSRQTVGFSGDFDALLEHGGGASVQHRDELLESLLDAVALAGHVRGAEPREVGHVRVELFETESFQIVVVEQQAGADLVQHTVDPRRTHVLHLRAQSETCCSVTVGNISAQRLLIGPYSPHAGLILPNQTSASALGQKQWRQREFKVGGRAL